MNPLRQKIMLLLYAGIAFGFSYTPQRQWKILKELSKAWKEIDKKKLQYEIKKLYQTKLVERKENDDGSYTLVLTEKGKLKALTYQFENMKINGENWDRKWRLVVFDVPEKYRKGRDALREKLKELGFYELQKSVFVFPYKCDDEVNFLIEFFDVRKYVRTGILEKIDNDFHLKQIFGLS